MRIPIDEISTLSPGDMRCIKDNGARYLEVRKTRFVLVRPDGRVWFDWAVTEDSRLEEWLKENRPEALL